MPARARDLIRALRALGVDVREPRKGGSHWVAFRGSVVYTIPLHNGEKTEVHDNYIRGACRAFGLDEKLLREKL